MNSEYLDLLERVLVNSIYEDPNHDRWNPKVYDAAARESGRDWPSKAMTMIGSKRLHQLRDACILCQINSIRGDFVETGVWRGGALMMMTAVAETKDRWHPERNIWGFDSFKGLPKPAPGEYPDPENDPHHTFSELAVSKEQVLQNFRKCGVETRFVKLVEGWFRDTLPVNTIEKIAVLRLDGDMFESTWLALKHLYHKVSPGGFCIIDDYGAVEGCRRAVQDFRSHNNIENEIVDIDGLGVYWRK